MKNNMLTFNYDLVENIQIESEVLKAICIFKDRKFTKIKFYLEKNYST